MKIGKKKSFILQTSKDSGCLIWMNAYALGKAVTNKIEVSACTVWDIVNPRKFLQYFIMTRISHNEYLKCGGCCSMLIKPY